MAVTAKAVTAYAERRSFMINNAKPTAKITTPPTVQILSNFI